MAGETLRVRLNREQRLSEKETIRIGEQLLEALIKVESSSLVHRDIKPENIMLLSDGRVVLLDFGIARHLNLPSLTANAAMFGPMTLVTQHLNKSRMKKGRSATGPIFLHGLR